MFQSVVCAVTLGSILPTVSDRHSPMGPKNKPSGLQRQTSEGCSSVRLQTPGHQMCTKAPLCEILLSWSVAEGSIEMVPASASVPGEHAGRPGPSDQHFKISKWISDIKSGHFSNSCFSPGPGVASGCESLRHFSGCWSALSLVVTCPIAFQSQMFWGFVPQMQLLTTGVLVG